MRFTTTPGKVLLIGLLTLMTTLSPPSSVLAEINVWRSIGPEGGWIYALAIDPTNPSTLYAGAYGGGMFKSTDGGATWNPVNTGLTNKSVWALAVDPTAPNTLYVATYGVFKSTNGCATWSPVNNGLTNLNVNALAIDPTDSNTLYAGTYYGGGVFKSTNGGATWSAVNTGLTTPIVYALAMNSTMLYAGTYYGGAFALQHRARTHLSISVRESPLSTIRRSDRTDSLRWPW